MTQCMYSHRVMEVRLGQTAIIKLTIHSYTTMFASDISKKQRIRPASTNNRFNSSAVSYLAMNIDYGTIWYDVISINYESAAAQ